MSPSVAALCGGDDSTSAATGISFEEAPASHLSRSDRSAALKKGAKTPPPLAQYAAAPSYVRGTDAIKTLVGTSSAATAAGAAVGGVSGSRTTHSTSNSALQSVTCSMKGAPRLCCAITTHPTSATPSRSSSPLPTNAALPKPVHRPTIGDGVLPKRARRDTNASATESTSMMNGTAPYAAQTPPAAVADTRCAPAGTTNTEERDGLVCDKRHGRPGGHGAVAAAGGRRTQPIPETAVAQSTAAI